MNRKYFMAAVCVLCATLMNSCRKQDDPASAAAGTARVKMEFFNKVAASPLKMDGSWYKNENGDSFTVSTFNYYISNVRFNKTDGSSFAEAESYHLVKQSDPSSLAFDIAQVPAGQYRSLTFTIGVDSTHNVSGAQSGALDPANGMFWSWHTGYIMFKLEGTSPVVTGPGHVFMLHAGGFSGAYNVLKTVTLDFPAVMTLDGGTPHIHLEADVLEAFRTPHVLTLATTSVIMSAGADATNLADNYSDMFRVTAAGN